ncbi:MAG: DUF2892 domain-containing protein, partial [Bacteroidota bacterium]
IRTCDPPGTPPNPVMIKNMGQVDRILRAALAILVVVLYVTDVIDGLAAIILGVLALVFLGTSFVGTCPLYLPFGLSTRRGG